MAVWRERYRFVLVTLLGPLKILISGRFYFILARERGIAAPRLWGAKFLRDEIDALVEN